MGKLLLEEVVGQRITISADLSNFEIAFAKSPFDCGSSELVVQGSFRSGDLSRPEPFEQLCTTLGLPPVVQFDRLHYISFRCIEFYAVRVDLRHSRFFPFRFGVQHLKPLVLRNIAEAISMHESTVSRVTNNKYISTPRGMLELKYFFTSSIASAAGGDAHSAESVRFKIKVLIDEEPPDKAHSDDRLVEILHGQGVDIARRTVAKYREVMCIPSSVQRRRDKSLTR